MIENWPSYNPVTDLNFNQENNIKFEEMNLNLIVRTLHVNFLTRTEFRYSGYNGYTRTIPSDDLGNHEGCEYFFSACVLSRFILHENSRNEASKPWGFHGSGTKSRDLQSFFHVSEDCVSLMREILTCSSYENRMSREHIYSIQEVNGHLISTI